MQRAKVGEVISIHAAREGGDGYVSRKRLGIIISIHAAREGGDLWLVSLDHAYSNFNPRRP